MAFLSAGTSAQSASRVLPIVFTATIFLSAALLFFVQPLFAKLVLPVLGGSSSVWTTAMLFFQLVLIAGYLYAHLATRFLGLTQQIALHLGLFAVALLFLPLGIPTGWSYDPDAATVPQTLALFAVGVGVPFAVLSANAPLIQAWYARSGGPSAHDPYFLYGASNLGSLIALLGFPLLAEPLFGVSAIGIGWAAGFVALGVFLLLSGTLSRTLGPGEVRLATEGADAPPRTSRAPTRTDIGWWIFYAFVPSSLMLAVTAKISTDLGSFPLIWTIPLSLYLLTFVLTFTKRPAVPDRILNIAFAVGFIALALHITGLFGGVTLATTYVLVAGFFVVALKSHRCLYARRPDGRHLTLFYVTMSIGGALGGVFNSVIAPLVFADIYELAVSVALASVLFVAAKPGNASRQFALGIAAGAAIILPLEAWTWIEKVSVDAGLYAFTAVFALAVILLRGTGWALVSATTVVLATTIYSNRGEAVFRDRSFFGTHEVWTKGDLRVYTNGTTVHGAQRIADLTAERPLPLYYYHPAAPMAQVLTSGIASEDAAIGVVGLGVGSLACYARPGQQWHFYEIDRAVYDMAKDPGLFTFMSSCAPEAPVHMGDARVVLETQDLTFDVLVIDAYSSDAVPMHLTTLEAVELYLQRLKPGGLLVFHISNRYYAIAPPLARIAGALGLEARLQDYTGAGGQVPEGASSSSVLVMSADAGTIDALPGGAEVWKQIGLVHGSLWTDDYADLLSTLKGLPGGW